VGGIGMSFLNNGAPLHITIGSATASPDNFASTLKNDLRLLKAVLLYADQVKLCEIGSTLALDILRLRHATADDLLSLMGLIIDLQHSKL
jgi:hypothetical protein